MHRFVLVHSPVVGPSTWLWVASALAARGHTVTVPAASEEVTRLTWEAFADSMAAQVAPEDHAVLVAHSGAGPLLPQIWARAARIPAGFVFVDAAMPPQAEDATLIPAGLLTELQAIATDGLLPVFSDWFGPAVMKDLIPDDAKRAIVTNELPRLPVSFFEERVPMPTEWTGRSCGYVHLSEQYAGEAAEASRRGWPTQERLGGHLDIVTRPEKVAEAIISITDQLAE